MTVVFSDLSGSTALGERLDPEVLLMLTKALAAVFDPYDLTGR